MLRRVVIAVVLVALISSDSDAQNRFRRRGTILGGVAGAAIGAAIGDSSDNEAVGAVLGAATGAVIGRSIGAQRDYRQTYPVPPHYSGPQNYAPTHVYPTYREPIYPAQVYPAPSPVIVTGPAIAPALPVAPPAAPPAVVPQSTRPITKEDVIAMMQSGLSHPMIAAQIQRNGVAHHLSVQDIIQLHAAGVSERLIEMMQANEVSATVIDSTPAVTVPPMSPHATYHSPTPTRAVPISPSGSSVIVHESMKLESPQ